MNQSCGNQRIAGCSFSVHPMADDFVKYIKDSLSEVDTTKVWMQTDDVTTTVRGKIEHVFDVTKAILLHIAKTDVHVAFQGTFSIGCPGDFSGDAYMNVSSNLMNEGLDIRQYIASKFSLYPLGGGEYMNTIYKQIDAMKEKGVHVAPAHYSTRLEGDTHDIFKGLEEVFRETQAQVPHTVMTVTVSANSPSHKEDLNE
ncbi:YkoF family thiamine/hydroxymethylpyrimidine-binding protein [Halobacillus yeomjeoni]|uniref:Thiamine-binding protein n=1 Tax=Halobacillus yeomjeoni TaxID=311194 RepID=A0A931HUK9_9BACI|nr:YkoF family thiamine/hydroxymethylpyrimidine-binding protein [Halobacillus yeomjeoni]MBH0229703.1 thiamine-binding protein [Halobacillus yeomjeoni]